MKVYEIISKDILDEGLGGGGAAAVAKGIGKVIGHFMPSNKEMALVNVTAKGMIANITNIIPGIALTSAIIEPIREYNAKISNSQKAVDLGNRTQAVHDEYREQRATVLVETLAMQIGGYLISKLGFGGVSYLLRKTPGLGIIASKLGSLGDGDKTLGKAARAVSAGAQTSAIAYLMDSLNNDEARKQLTTITLLGDKTMPGQLFIKAVDFLDKKIDSAIAYATGKEQPAAPRTAAQPVEPKKPNLSPSGLKWDDSYWK